jgi:polysaccharide biosynthesis protein VpsM
MFHSVNAKILARTALCLGGVLSAAQAFELGRGRVESSFSARSDFDSNIYTNSSEVEDFVFSGSGTATYIRDVGLISSQVAVGARSSVFVDNGDQDTFDPFASGRVTYMPSDKTTVLGGVSYQRSTMANETLNDRTRSDDLLVDGSAQVLFSDKLGYRVSGKYSSSDYSSAGYADVLSYTAGLDGVYLYSPKLTVLAGYSYRESWTENRALGAIDPESEDSRFSAGLEGDIAPKISGSLRVGVIDRTFKSAAFDGSSSLFLASGLKWVVTPKTTGTVDVLQDFDTTAANQSSKNSTFTVGVNQVINQKWSASGSVGYAHSNLQGAFGAGSRTDDIYRVKAQLVYALASNMSLEFSAGYSDADSDSAVSVYDRFVTGVGVTATF